MGYFNDVNYEMFMYEGVYYLFMSMQDFQRYNQNTQGNPAYYFNFGNVVS